MTYTYNTTIREALNLVEDNLYIDHELTPISRDWKDEIQTYGYTYFDYDGTAKIKVTMRRIGKWGLQFSMDEE